MIKLNEKILIQQLYRFIIVGLLNTTINYSVFYSLFIVGIDYKISGALGFICGGILGFFLNRAWTFNASVKGVKIIIKYILIQLVSLLGHSSSQIAAVELFSIHEYLSQIIGIMVSMSLNFIFLKIYVFSRQ